MSNLTDEESRQRFEELFTEMFSESDRGCILIGASVLDETLGLYLRSRLERNDHVAKHAAEALFSGMGPLSSFSSRIKLAYCLGLIEKWEFEDLERIRKIRNKAAHEYSGKSFADNEIIQITMHLQGADHAVSAAEFYREKVEQSEMPKLKDASAPPTKERLRFQFTVVYLAGRFDMHWTLLHKSNDQ